MIFLKFKNKLLLIISILLITIIPINTLAYSNYVIASGKTIGIQVNSKGVLVVGFYEVDNAYIGKDAGFEIGDKITKVNNQDVETISSMVDALNKEGKTRNLNTFRNEKTFKPL